MTLERKDFVTTLIPDDETDHEFDMDNPVVQREHKAIQAAFEQADRAMIEIKSIPC